MKTVACDHSLGRSISPPAKPEFVRYPARLQRKCACRGTPDPSDGREECKKKRLNLQTKLAINEPGDQYEQEADRVAEEIMRERRSGPALVSPLDRRGAVQDKATGDTQTDKSPSVVDEVLQSQGQPLDAGTRIFMEKRFGYDFGRVRVHRDARAAESARAVNAHAYTVGQDIVFDSGAFAPETSAGRRLLAHELTHTLQQATTVTNPLSERACEREAEHLSTQAAGRSVKVEGKAKPGAPQRKDKNPLDETAKKIIEAGKDTTKTINQRSIDAVNSIVKAYYDPALVDSVVFKEKLDDDPDFKGLVTSPVGTGKDIKGKITVVSSYFIDNIDSFARRVLQVGHELQHVEQQRAGMGGESKKKEREFLAFHWEATQPEKSGTGRMSHASRVSLIDEALRNYYCMPETDRKGHADKKEELLKLRGSEEKAGGNEHTEPPKECKKK